MKPIRLVGGCAAAEQTIAQDFLARGWIKPCPAFKLASNGFVVLEKEKGKWRLLVDYRQLNQATLPDAHPLFRTVVAPVVTRSKVAPRAQGASACDPPALASAPVGGGTKQKRKLRRLE